MQGHLYTYGTTWYIVAKDLEHREILHICKLHKDKETWLRLEGEKYQEFKQSIKDGVLEYKNDGHFSQYADI